MINIHNTRGALKNHEDSLTIIIIVQHVCWSCTGGAAAECCFYGEIQTTIQIAMSVYIAVYLATSPVSNRILYCDMGVLFRLKLQ